MRASPLMKVSPVRVRIVRGNMIGTQMLKCPNGQVRRVRVVVPRRVLRKQVRRIAKRYALRARRAGVEVGGFFSFVSKAVKSVGRFVKNKVVRAVKKVAKAVVRSPIVKWGARVAAVAFPAVGIPAMAAVAAANKVLDMVEKGGAIARKAMGAIGSIKKKAARGDRRAIARLKVIKAAKRARTTPRRRVVFVARNGRRFPASYARGIVRVRIGRRVFVGRPRRGMARVASRGRRVTGRVLRVRARRARVYSRPRRPARRYSYQRRRPSWAGARRRPFSWAPRLTSQRSAWR